MIGRSGRNGCPSQAHVLFKAKDVDTVDVHLKSICIDQENCRCSTILSGVGSCDYVHNATNCCDVCTGGKVPYPRLDILRCVSRPRKKKSCELREVDSHMKKQVKMVLLEERDTIIRENPGYMMLGKNYVYSDHVIDTIVDKSASGKAAEDFLCLCLRPEYCDRVFKRVWDIICSAPPPRKRRRKCK